MQFNSLYLEIKGIELNWTMSFLLSIALHCLVVTKQVFMLTIILSVYQQCPVPVLYIKMICLSNYKIIDKWIFLCLFILGKITDNVLRLVQKARARLLGPFHPFFDLHGYINEGLHKVLPENIHELASGRLFVSLTRVWDKTNTIVSEFKSKEEVIQVCRP